MTFTPLTNAQLTPQDAAELRTPNAADLHHARDAHSAREAAQKFEALLIQQLLQVMRKSAPTGGLGGEDSGGQMYLQMFDEQMAEQMSQGQGLGLQDMLMRALGASEQEIGSGAGSRSHVIGTVHQTGNGTYSGWSVRSLQPVETQGTPMTGLGSRLQYAASSMMQPGTVERWGRDGRLQPEDLGAGFSAETRSGGVGQFSVLDANGYENDYKCNLFAFELARRAGFQVPVVGRTHGYGYPIANNITPDASDGRVAGDWARVVTGESVATLSAGAAAGTRAFMLSGDGTDGRRGHMAVVERIRDIQYDPTGNVRRIVFDGWEGRQQGAQHIENRVWNVYGNAGGGGVQRNGFQRIEILELKSAAPGTRPEVVLSRARSESVLDNSQNIHSAQRGSSYGP